MPHAKTRHATRSTGLARRATTATCAGHATRASFLRLPPHVRRYAGSIARTYLSGVGATTVPGAARRGASSSFRATPPTHHHHHHHHHRLADRVSAGSSSSSGGGGDDGVAGGERPIWFALPPPRARERREQSFDKRKRPSARRGPGIVSVDRNVRSKCRCSCVLQFTS